MNQGIFRLLDANFNRAREAVRVLEDFARIYLTERDRKDIEDRKERIRKRLAEIPTGEGRRAFIEAQLRLQLFSLETHRRKELNTD